MPNYPKVIIMHSIGDGWQINLAVNSIATLNLCVQSASMTASTPEPTHMLSGDLLITLRALERPWSRLQLPHLGAFAVVQCSSPAFSLPASNCNKNNQKPPVAPSFLSSHGNSRVLVFRPLASC